ncbi:beta-hydroxyacyl-ACP dehydratase [Candidatus Pelagibacter sp.]|nr:beta-hydroxyacyl-ACP dehydratase [Candidatus Pelagibacter sp.]
MSKLKLDKEQILNIQQNEDPYLFVDYATEVVPGVSAKGYKKFEDNDWFFKVHWKNDPNVPGMLQIESLVQMSSLAIVTLPNNRKKILYLVSANDIKFSKKITPGKTLFMETFIKSFKRGLANCEGYGYLDKSLACKAKFTLLLPDLLKSYSLKN